MFGQVFLVSCDGERRLDVHTKPVFIPLSWCQHKHYSRGVQGLGRQPLSCSFHHMTTLHGHIMGHPVTPLPRFFFFNYIFPFRELLSYNSSFGSEFWFLTSPSIDRAGSLHVPYLVVTPAGDLCVLGMSPALAWRKPVLFRSQESHMESALKLFNGRTSFQSLCLLKILTGCLSLKCHS